MFYLKVCLLIFGLFYGDLADDFVGSPEITETTCECGKVNKFYGRRIVGGNETEEHQYPFLVYIDRGNNQFCGGSIITSRHILTAAHCTQGNPSTHFVQVALHNWRKPTTTTKTYYVDKIFNHPGYKKKLNIDDISIVLLKKIIKFNQHVGRICLPTGPLDIENKQVTAMGWGVYTKFYDKYPDNLQQLSLKVLRFDLCYKYMSGEIETASSNPKRLCTFAVGKGPCIGDSGGPLVWLDPDTNSYTQVALNSYLNVESFWSDGSQYNIKCANKYPTVSTRISTYLDWIKNIIKASAPLPFCMKKM